MAGKMKDLALPLMLLAGLLGIFVAPWFVPQGQPVCSASYTLGFNNLVASLALAALLAGLFVYLMRRPDRGGSTGNALAQSLFSPRPRGGSRSSLVAFGVVATLTVAVLLSWYAAMPFIKFGEFGSDLSRLDLMVLGLRPYRDFQYNYGPAMLYPAYWIYQFFGGAVSIDAAYCAVLVMHWVGGLALLHFTVSSICSGWWATAVFLCGSLAVFNISMGLGYTPLRFLAPIASLLFLHRTFSRWLEQGTAGRLKGAGVALLLSLGSLALSPEMGISTVAGITIFFAALFFTPLRRLSIVALVPVASLGIAVVAFSANYAEGVFAFGGGANNYPVFPTLAILFLIATSCLVLPHLGVLGVRERNHHGALALGLAVGLGLLIPAAFGRCDQGHVLFNGLGIMILVLALAARLPGRAGAALVFGSCLLIHGVLGTVVGLQGNAEVRNVLAVRASLAGFDDRKNAERWRAATGASGRLVYGKLLPLLGNMKKLLDYDRIGTPFYLGEEIDRFIKLSGRYSPEYYSGMNMQVYTPAAVSRKIRDLSAMSVILIPKDGESYPVVVDESAASVLSSYLPYPAWLIPQRRRPPYVPGREVMAYIRDHFTVVRKLRKFDIWARRVK